MSLLQLVLLGWIILAAIYIAAWLASRAFFDNKADYHKKVLQQLEETTDAEEK